MALAARRRADQRFDPAAALAATIRYLKIARGRLGRDDLAVVSYHMGIGNLQAVLASYGESGPSYVRVFFDSTPLSRSKVLMPTSVLLSSLLTVTVIAGVESLAP